MIPHSWPSTRSPARCPRLCLAVVVTMAFLLCLPATGFAGEREAQTERGESFATALSTAGLLARGAGYGSTGGSKLVRGLQGRLSKLGHKPGPIDGLLGPVTEGAILRFQQARGLTVDGVVGPQTKAKLVGLRAERPGRASKPRAKRPPADTPEPRPSPGPSPSASPSPSLQSPPPAAPQPSPAEREPSAGIAPAYAALLGALAAGLLLSALWAATARRTRRPSPEPPAESPTTGSTRLNVGVACAALLGVFAAGAVGGAAFATRAAPDADDLTAPDRDVAAIEPLGPASAAASRPPLSPPPPARSRTAAPSRSTSPRRTARASTENRQTPEPRKSPAPSVRANPPPRVETYTVQPGDSLWPIAEEQPPPTTSVQAVARRVARIKALNGDRFTSSDPNVLVAGEQLRLR
jgi:peptidoglycan hydrolase-like protein with peptidoglycan-binding domain